MSNSISTMSIFFPWESSECLGLIIVPAHLLGGVAYVQHTNDDSRQLKKIPLMYEACLTISLPVSLLPLSAMNWLL